MLNTTHLRLLVLTVPLIAPACRTVAPPSPKVVVTVDVDFGVADHATRTKQVMVPEGSSPIDAIESFLPVERGFVCCTRRDLWSVDGVTTDFEGGHYWLWRLNGRSLELAPDKYDLENGDHIAWVYAKSDKPQHRRN